MNGDTIYWEEGTKISTISRITTWSDNQVLSSVDLNREFDNIINDYNGSITNANISATAAIATSKINVTFPSGTIVGTTDTQTLTNKTLTSPTINTAVIDTPRTIGAYENWVTDTDGATVTFDLDAGNKHRVTLAGNRTLALSNVQNGHAFIIHLIQDGTGSRTVTWFSTINWAGGSAPTLTTTASKADTFGFLQTAAATYAGYVIGQNIWVK